MKKLLVVIMIALTMLMLMLGVSAASTNEFGEIETNASIDLTGMAADTSARVVLYDGNEYHTYPARYIVTSANGLAFDFSRINAAFTKSYNNKSVIRIEVPSHVTALDNTKLFAYGNNNNIKEVAFTEDTHCTSLCWGGFENNTSLERVVMPKTLTTVGNNLFANCTALKELIFPKDSVITEIAGDKFLNGCKAIEVLVFPNSLKKVSTNALAVCASLKVVVFGASFESIGGAWSDMGSGATYYIPASFFGENVTTEPPSNLFHWAGASGNGVDGNNNNPKNLTFVFTGTKAQAEALQNRFKAADDSRGYIGLKRLWDATLCTEEEYFELTGSKVGEGTTKGNFLVYGYNVCKAFYDNEHQEKLNEGETDTNLCVLTECSKCGIKGLDTSADSTHIFGKSVIAYANGFASQGTATTACQNSGCVCNTSPFVESVLPIYNALGYSVNELGTSLTLGYTVNYEAYAAYLESDENNKVVFGFVAYATYEDEYCAPLYVESNLIAPVNKNNTIFAQVSDEIYAYDFVVRGFDETTQNFALVMCAYTYDGESIKYLCNKDGVYGAYDVAYSTTISKER